MKTVIVLIALLAVMPAFAGNHPECEEHNYPCAVNGKDGDNTGAGFGLINPTYDYDYDGWQGGGGVSQFDGRTSEMLGVGKKLPHNGFLNIDIGNSDGKQGAGAAASWKF